MMLRNRVGGLLVATLALLFAVPAQAEKNALTCQALPGLMERYLEAHISRPKLEGEFLDRVAERYVNGLDPSKSLLLKSEVDALRARIRTFAERIEKDGCGVLHEIQRKQVERHAQMEEQVRKLLADPKLEVDRSVVLTVDADERSYPATEAERDELRRRFLHFQLANYVATKTKMEEARKKLTHRYELITKRAREQGEAEVYAQFLDAFASAFDPHSTYLSAEALENFRIGMALSLEGIGAVLRSKDGYTEVHEVVPGGAAARHGGLKSKDLIVAVGQEKGDMVDVIDMGLNDVVQMIRGKKGTKVRLTVLRQGEKSETHTLTIVRDKIDLKEQAAKLTWQALEHEGRQLNLAVIELPSFYGGREDEARQCTDDMKALLKEVNEKKADGLLLDLSRNSGGLLQHAVEITGYFLRRGAVVGVEGPDVRLQVLDDTDPTIQYKGPLVVLTSRASASASEILAGAVRDYRRGVVVGDDQTFGKGSVQNVVTLPPGFGALKVTTAMFFRPGGESTQSKGVEADIIVPSPFAADVYGEEHQTYALPPRRIQPFASKEVNFDDPARGWKAITADEIARLARRSAERQAADAKIQEVLAERQKAKNKAGKVSVAELLDGTTKAEGEEDEEKKDEGLSPQASEALRILGDLVSDQVRAADAGRR